MRDIGTAGDRLDLAHAEGVFKMRMHGIAQHPNHVDTTLSVQFFLEEDTSSGTYLRLFMLGGVKPPPPSSDFSN